MEELNKIDFRVKASKFGTKYVAAGGIVAYDDKPYQTKWGGKNE